MRSNATTDRARINVPYEVTAEQLIVMRDGILMLLKQRYESPAEELSLREIADGIQQAVWTVNNPHRHEIADALAVPGNITLISVPAYESIMEAMDLI